MGSVEPPLRGGEVVSEGVSCELDVFHPPSLKKTYFLFQIGFIHHTCTSTPLPSDYFFHFPNKLVVMVKLFW